MYVGRVLADRPYGFWGLDTASPFADLSGSANNATASGTYKSANTLVAGGGTSLVVNSSYMPVFSFPFMKAGYERRSWSMEVWFHPLLCDDSIYVLKHDGSNTGIAYDGANLTFEMYFTGGTSAIVSYEVLVREAMHIVATHTEGRNCLYVNGELVGSAEISEAQLIAGYDITTPSTTVSSGSASTDLVLLDSVAFYGYDLSLANVKTHFVYGKDVTLVTDSVTQNYGYLFEPCDDSSDIYMKLSWNTDQDFNQSPKSTVSITDGLKPGLDGAGLPIVSSWTMPVNMNAIASTIVNYIRIGWIGTGTFLVELTLDGTTWNTVTNDRAISLGANDVNQDIFQIRVSFDGTDANAVVEYLDFTVYKTSTITGDLNPRVVTYEGIVTVNRTFNEPIDHNLKRGADVSAGGRINVTVDQESTVRNAKTIDVWANFNMASTFVIFDMRSVGNTGRPYLIWNGSALTSQGVDKLYINGLLVTIGSWVPKSNDTNLFTTVLTTAANYGVFLGSAYTGAYVTTGQIESFAFYETEPTAAVVLKMYNSCYGIVSNVISDGNTIAVTENVNAYELYSYPWSITGAG